MKFKLKNDFWGIAFAAGTGVLTYLIYLIGKDNGGAQVCEELNADLAVLVEQAKQEHIGQ